MYFLVCVYSAGVNLCERTVNTSMHVGLFVFRCMCVCARAHVCLFVSSVNYLQHWQCLSIVDGNGKYVSLWLFFSGNSIQHLSTAETSCGAASSTMCLAKTYNIPALVVAI